MNIKNLALRGGGVFGLTALANSVFAASTFGEIVSLVSITDFATVVGTAATIVVGAYLAMKGISVAKRVISKI